MVYLVSVFDMMKDDGYHVYAVEMWILINVLSEMIL